MGPIVHFFIKAPNLAQMLINMVLKFSDSEPPEIPPRWPPYWISKWPPCAIWTDINLIKVSDYTCLRSRNHIILVQNWYTRLGTIDDGHIGFQNGRRRQYKNISILRSRKDIILIWMPKYIFLGSMNQDSSTKLINLSSNFLRISCGFQNGRYVQYKDIHVLPSNIDTV